MAFVDGIILFDSRREGLVRVAGAPPEAQPSRAVRDRIAAVAHSGGGRLGPVLFGAVRKRWLVFPIRWVCARHEHLAREERSTILVRA